LASVAIDAENGALLVLGAWPILDLLLNTPPEETLENRNQRISNIMKHVNIKVE